jgi:1-acyl-sn-glycerol-3-phosphate acyltransferase
MTPRLRFAFFSLRWFIGAGFKLAFRLKVVGRGNLPDDGPALVIGNHASFLDPFIMSSRCGRPVQWLVTQEFYGNPRVHWLLWWFGTIPVGGGRSMVRSYRQIAEVLKQGGLIGIFPEGGITRDGEMKAFRTGTAVIAFRMGVPIVPMHIQGTYEALSRYAKWPRFVPVTIRMGAPIPVDQKPDPTPEEIDALTATMRAAVVALETDNRAERR